MVIGLFIIGVAILITMLIVGIPSMKYLEIITLRLEKIDTLLNIIRLTVEKSDLQSKLDDNMKRIDRNRTSIEDTEKHIKQSEIAIGIADAIQCYLVKSIKPEMRSKEVEQNYQEKLAQQPDLMALSNEELEKHIDSEIEKLDPDDNDVKNIIRVYEAAKKLGDLSDVLNTKDYGAIANFVSSMTDDEKINEFVKERASYDDLAQAVEVYTVKVATVELGEDDARKAFSDDPSFGSNELYNKYSIEELEVHIEKALQGFKDQGKTGFALIEDAYTRAKSMRTDKTEN